MCAGWRGLTGGIASGKSAVAKLLLAKGAAVVDADQLAREVVAPGQPALAELVARFGAAILTADGQLDRKRLASIAFADEQARRDLNRITHPRIAAASAQAIAAWTDAGANVVFYEAALLIENRVHTGLTGTIVVSASPEVQQILIDVYRGDPKTAELCERLVDLDEGFQEWRYRHVKMVERTIGTKAGTGGSAGAEYLRTTLGRNTFPDLWEIRLKL